MSTVAPPDNRSGFGRGQYAKPADVAEYMKRMNRYLTDRNSEWLDRWCDRGGEIHPAVKDLCSAFQAEGHLTKWAEEQGWLAQGSVPDGGIKNRQMGMYTAIVYHRSLDGRKAIAFELQRYIGVCALQHLSRLAVENPDLVARIPGRWLGCTPEACDHRWSFPRGGGAKCRRGGGEFHPTGDVLEAQWVQASQR